MFSTGPMFLTMAFARFGGDRSSLWAIPEALYSSRGTAFFRHYKGSSWHGWDSQFIFMVYTKWKEFLVVAVVFIAMLISIVRRKRCKPHKR